MDIAICRNPRNQKSQKGEETTIKTKDVNVSDTHRSVKNVVSRQKSDHFAISFAQEHVIHDDLEDERPLGGQPPNGCFNKVQ